MNEVLACRDALSQSESLTVYVLEDHAGETRHRALATLGIYARQRLPAATVKAAFSTGPRGAGPQFFCSPPAGLGSARKVRAVRREGGDTFLVIFAEVTGKHFGEGARQTLRLEVQESPLDQAGLTRLIGVAA